MARIHWRGGTLLAPLPPALVSCQSSDGQCNLITVAWTGILSTVPPKTYVSIRPSRHSFSLIEESGEFVIHLPPASLAREVDFCGMYTGSKLNKLEKTGLHIEPSSVISTPTVSECPVALECRVTQKIPLGSHVMFMADIVAVTVDERLLDKEGALHLEKADLLAYAHGEYYRLGAALGKFGFSAAKKKKKRRAANKPQPHGRADNAPHKEKKKERRLPPKDGFRRPNKAK